MFQQRFVDEMDVSTSVQSDVLRDESEEGKTGVMTAANW